MDVQEIHLFIAGFEVVLDYFFDFVFVAEVDRSDFVADDGVVDHPTGT